MTPQERAEKLADAHWGYIHALILEHGAGEELAKVVGFHYRTAFCHGYKHATEDARETARAAFTPVQEEVSCHWIYQGGCTFMTACGQEVVYETMLPDTCPYCGRKRVTAGADRWAVQEKKAPTVNPVQEEVVDLDGLMPREYPFAFPPALKWMGKSALDYVTKLREEVKEVADAMRIEDAVEEMFDVIHTAETGIRTCCEYAGLDAGAIRDAVERKNRVRGYYEPQG